MSCTVGQVMELLCGVAPVELAEEWDNVGLLVGDREAEVDCVLCALDFTQGVLDEAIAAGAQMIVTHHPIMFRGRQKLTCDDMEGRLLLKLIRNGIALAAMHTNFDFVHPGVNDALAAKLGLRDIEPAEGGMCTGCVEEMKLSEFRKRAEAMLGGPVRMYGPSETVIRKVAVLGGAGEDFVSLAKDAGAQVYVTGEMAYHKGLLAVDSGVCVLEAGHAATENPAISRLVDALQIAINDVQYKVRVLRSNAELFL